MKKLNFYTTSSCHLCEKAKIEIQQAKKEIPIKLYSIDISNSDNLIDKYGTKIPVIRENNSNQELHWPFSSQHIIDWLTSLPYS